MLNLFFHTLIKQRHKKNSHGQNRYHLLIIQPGNFGKTQRMEFDTKFQIAVNQFLVLRLVV